MLCVPHFTVIPALFALNNRIPVDVELVSNFLIPSAEMKYHCVSIALACKPNCIISINGN